MPINAATANEASSLASSQKIMAYDATDSDGFVKLPVSLFEADSQSRAAAAQAAAIAAAASDATTKMNAAIQAAAPQSHNQAIGTITGLQAALDALNARLAALEVSPGTAPTITSNGGGSTAAVSVQSGVTTAVVQCVATGSSPITYSLTGADASSFTINSSSGAVTPNAALIYASGGDNIREFNVVATNGSGSDSQAVTLTILPSTALVTGTDLPMQGADYARLWGPATHTLDTLSNFYTTAGYLVAMRFRANASANVIEYKGAWPDGDGYAGGNGGTMRVRIMPDDGTSNHYPNMGGTPLATGTYTPALVGGLHSTSTQFDAVTLTPSAPLVAGTLYHLVIDNTDGSPDTNWISVNAVATVGVNGRPGRWASTTDWAILEGSGGGWIDYTVTPFGANNLYHSPLMQIKYAGGVVQGHVDIEGGTDSATSWAMTAGGTIRERFTPNTTRSVVGFSFATCSSAAGSLAWALKQGGSVIDSGTIVESSPTHAIVGGVIDLSWKDCAFAAARTLTSGTTYDLQFTVVSGTWHFVDERDGSDYGFVAPAAFPESLAEHFHLGTWKDAYHWDLTADSFSGAHWRVVMHLA